MAKKPTAKKAETKSDKPEKGSAEYDRQARMGTMSADLGDDEGEAKDTGQTGTASGDSK